MSVSTLAYVIANVH